MKPVDTLAVLSALIIALVVGCDDPKSERQLVATCAHDKNVMADGYGRYWSDRYQIRPGTPIKDVCK